jgi:Domain of unknown function (DUF4276)
LKILFVSDGNHDLGPSGSASEPRPAAGILPTLARKVVPAIAAESIALRWAELSRFPVRSDRGGFKTRSTGYAAKVAAAKLMATRRFYCAAVVCVADRDGARHADRLDQMKNGRDESAVACPVACGLAVESIEAWTLGAPEALAAELGVPVSRVQALYPRAPVEALKETSEKDDHRPKHCLDRIAALGSRSADAVLRAEVAARTDIAALERACPEGFAPFAAELRSVLGGPASPAP